MKRLLTEELIGALQKAPHGQRYMVHDALVPGFGVRVTDVGGKTYVLVHRFGENKNPTRRKIGTYGGISLEEAREVARKMHAGMADFKAEMRKSRDIQRALRRELKGKDKAMSRNIDSEQLGKIRSILEEMSYKDFLLFGELVVTLLPEAQWPLGGTDMQDTVISRFFGWSLAGDVDGEILRLWDEKERRARSMPMSYQFEVTSSNEIPRR